MHPQLPYNPLGGCYGSMVWSLPWSGWGRRSIVQHDGRTGRQPLVATNPCQEAVTQGATIERRLGMRNLFTVACQQEGGHGRVGCRTRDEELDEHCLKN